MLGSVGNVLRNLSALGVTAGILIHTMAAALGFGSPLYITFYALLILFFYISQVGLTGAFSDDARPFSRLLDSADALSWLPPGWAADGWLRSI